MNRTDSWDLLDRLRRYHKVNRVVGKYTFLLFYHKGSALLKSLIGQRIVEEMDLAEDADLWRSIRIAFEDLGPTFVKFGQILSTLSDGLPKGLQQEFTHLQEKVVYLPYEVIKARVEQELGAPISDRFASFEKEPLAGASIGQAHAAVLKSGEEVVVKVMRPNIRKIVEYDLKALLFFAWLFQKFTPFGRHIHFVDRVKLLKKSLHNEMNYLKEAEHLKRFSALFKGDPNVHYPKVYPEYTTRRILTMEFIRGIKIYEISDTLDAEAKDKLAKLIARHFFKQIHLYGFFHSDPHPGNIIITGPERFAVIDCGMVGTLTESFRKSFMREAVGFASGDVEAIFHAWYEMGLLSVGEDLSELRPKLEKLVDSFNVMNARTLESLDFARITRDIFNVLSQVSDSPQFLMLEKTYLTLYGVLTMLTPKINLFEISKDVALTYFENEVEKVFSNQTAILSSQTILDVKEMFFRLPKRLDNIIINLERGEQKIKFINEEMAKTQKSIAARLNQIFLLMAIGLILFVTQMLFPEVQKEIFLGMTLKEIGKFTALTLGGWVVIKWIKGP